MLLFIMLYKVVLTFVCENVLSVTIQTKATEHYFSVVLFVNAVQGDSNFCTCG